jgi:hypothetical protein
MHDVVRWQHHPLMAFMPGWSARVLALLGFAQQKQIVLPSDRFKVHDPLALYGAILPS